MNSEKFESNASYLSTRHRSETASMEMLIEVHYQLSDMNFRLNGFEFDFLQQILALSEREVRRQMSAT